MYVRMNAYLILIDPIAVALCNVRELCIQYIYCITVCVTCLGKPGFECTNCGDSGVNMHAAAIIFHQKLKREIQNILPFFGTSAALMSLLRGFQFVSKFGIIFFPLQSKIYA